MLFDLVGIPFSNAFKLNECLKETKTAVNDEKRLEIQHKQIDSIGYTSNTFIADVNLLNEMLETNVFNENKLKRNESIRKTPKASMKSNKSLKDEDGSNTQEAKRRNPKANVLTVIHNVGSVRPRNALRMMISKKNTWNMDVILNEICNLFKLEYANVRRLFTMSGVLVIFKILQKW